MPSSEIVVSSQSVSEKKKVHDIYILDVSGSMGGSKYDSAIEGIRQSIKDNINNNEVEVITTVCTFDNATNIKFPILKEPTTEQLLKVELQRPSGLTALRDAIGKTFSIFDDAKENILVKIFTDGGENGSVAYSQSQIAKLIANKKAQGWTITFIGTKEDVQNVINQFGIDKSNTLSHNNTAEGIAAAYEVTRSATANYSKSLSVGKNVSFGFFNSDND